MIDEVDHGRAPPRRTVAGGRMLRAIEAHVTQLMHAHIRHVQ